MTEKEEKTEETTETPKLKRVFDLDIDENMIQTQVLLPEKYQKKLGALSLLKEKSKGALVREALRDFFEAEERRTETPKGFKVSDLVLNDILKQSSTFWGNQLVDGENGYIVLAKQHGIKFSDLSDTQFERVAEKLVIGYKGYAFPPTIDEFIGKFSELELTDKQKDFLREKLGGEPIEEAMEEEEGEEEGGTSKEEGGHEEEISDLLEECKLSLSGFEIEGEEGFIAQVKARELTGKMWTNDLLKEVADLLKVGYDGYLDKPDREELLTRVVEAMKLTVRQRKVLKDAFESAFEEEEETEEYEKEEEW